MNNWKMFLIGVIFGFLFGGSMFIEAFNEKLQNGHVHDCDGNSYRIEKETQ